MILGELPQHPDFRLLLHYLEKRVDDLTGSVLSAAQCKDLTEIRSAAGYRTALADLLGELHEARRKVE